MVYFQDIGINFKKYFSLNHFYLIILKYYILINFIYI